MPEAQETAIIVPVGAAEPVVAEHRRRLDRAASWGIPAHITVLYPFVAPGDVDDEVLGRLAAVFAEAAPFDCTFAECRWFGDEVLWLAPDRARAFRDLTDAVVKEFPDHPPYGGTHDDPVPHLTVGLSRWGSVDDLRAAEAEVSLELPINARIDRAVLVAGSDQPDSWHTVAELPLGRTGP